MKEKMNDRELLEYAAKAVGLVIEEYPRNDPFWVCVHRSDAILNGDGEYPLFKWHPRNDDGDALRLAVKLQIFNTAEQFREFQSFYSDEIKKSGMPTAATRLAIVQIAAAIGKSMESKQNDTKRN